MRSIDDHRERASRGPRWALPVRRRWALVLVCAGALAGVTGLLSQPTQIVPAYVAIAFYFLTLSLGAVALLALLRLSAATWSAPLEPILDGMGAYLPLGAASMLAVVPGIGLLYPWAEREGRGVFLNVPAFVARMLIILGAWVILGRLLRSTDPSRPASRREALALLGIAATFIVATFDWIVSIDYPWVSALAPVANLAGALAAAIAALAVVVLVARRVPGNPEIGPGRLQDLGQLLFGASSVCGYLWFFEQLAVWCARLPDEVAHQAARSSGGWGVMSVLEPSLSAAVPCILLLRAGDKRSEPRLLAAAIAALVGRLLSLVLSTTPALNPVHHGLGPYELAMVAGFAGLFLLSLVRALRAQRDAALVGDEGAFSPRSTP
jgi:hypothetical protein